jgi:hypothetical protein
MAVGIKRIEKEFLFKSVFDEQIPVTLLLEGKETKLSVLTIEKDHIRFRTPFNLGLKKGQKANLYFTYREQVVSFKAKVIECGESQLITDLPDSLYKNLSRKYARIIAPPSISLSFSFRGERYELRYPKTDEYESAEAPEASPDFNAHDIKSLIEQFNQRTAAVCDTHKIVMFRERQPQGFDEELVASTGKILFIPSTLASLPAIDPYVKKRIVTQSIFESFLASKGIPQRRIEDEAGRYLREKRTKGVLSELMCPVIFQEYVIGYIHLANSEQGLPPFDLDLVDLMAQFAKILAYSLKINGYFKNAPKNEKKYGANIIDISASGALFSSDQSGLAQSLVVGSELNIELKAGARSVTMAGKIVRRYADASTIYYGVDFRDMKAEDLRFIFELLYGRPFSDADMSLLEGGEKSKGSII